MISCRPGRPAEKKNKKGYYNNTTNNNNNNNLMIYHLFLSILSIIEYDQAGWLAQDIQSILVRSKLGLILELLLKLNSKKLNPYR